MEAGIVTLSYFKGYLLIIAIVLPKMMKIRR